MRFDRVLLAVPVVAGAVLTGTALAYPTGSPTVRDAVYGEASTHQTCWHNGVHFNKQNHPNCGLHKGWGEEPAPPPEEPGEPGGTGDEQAPATDTTRSEHGSGGAHKGDHGHKGGHGKSGGHGGMSTHGAAGTHGGHSGEHGGKSATHGHSGGHGRGKGHGKH
jgi:hypothetical protein